MGVFQCALNTPVKALDGSGNLEFRYYIISGIPEGSLLSGYAEEVSLKEYERLMPQTKAPYTNYHFIVGDNLILLSHYGMVPYYESYDIDEYTGCFREKL
ncbi:hypothetical protein RCC89_14665 [Cytophagaceae bacterium ABcell3]|nr:hypothetical protein RCC89_14665 [Cytophagaceae bacterium ABcell3]